MSRTSNRRGQSVLRIIGGQWRGRKLGFTPAEGLRPTTDRVRETLFNWLAPDIHGARCLDLFAGSGALGLEALSRGAAHCDFVDNSAQVIRQLYEHLQVLDAVSRARLVQANALEFLRRPEKPWDIVFIDPPFGLGLAAPCCEHLQQPGMLSDNALVYVETATGEAPPQVPPRWQCHREKVAGGVAYRLYIVSAG
ncbi:16S rRNA (guanine(966)-N(2))-methyltransferase RsmD [Haliea sp. E17]|uniref:16S rRNA (guanine(966)-N(2))-methyltransferase RsmD n=1 Tax=Haliea sp. E17 TaxID=3401576 RepID=UPI003AAAB1D0